MDRPEQPQEPPPGGPGGGQYQPPPYTSRPPEYPLPQPRQSNPWMWIGITCIIIAVIAIAGIVICLVVGLRNPEIREMFGSISEEAPRIDACETQLDHIGAALLRYADDHDGQFPAALDDLVPKYMKDNAEFVCPSDPRGAQYDYKQPNPTDPDDTPVIACTEHQMGMMTMKLTLQKDGDVVTGQ